MPLSVRLCSSLPGSTPVVVVPRIVWVWIDAQTLRVTAVPLLELGLLLRIQRSLLQRRHLAAQAVLDRHDGGEGRGSGLLSGHVDRVAFLAIGARLESDR